MNRVVLGLSYDGQAFEGWQTQPHGRTVQDQLSKAIESIAQAPVSLTCAGRTDTGVHARQQVVHFDTDQERPLSAWVKGVNNGLPETISVQGAKRVDDQFHARFSALNRTYRYLLSDAKTPSGLLHDQVTWSSRPLDVDAMREAAAYLVGQHDFTSFRATQCQAKSPVRRIEYLHLVRRGDLIVLEVQANAFLHHMVRNIVGVLMAVGAGDKPPNWIAEVLAARDRSAGGVTAKPFGLYLVGVDYPAHFGLSVSPPGPLFFTEPLGCFAPK